MTATPLSIPTPLSIHQRLAAVQNVLKVPKSQRNTFGNYNYRSTEDIVEALKPHLADHGLLLNISDEIVMVGDRYYVKASVEATALDVGGNIRVTAYAREEESKKGADGSQITGAASSYARKYALNGMFLIDDTKDSDATNTGEPKTAQPAPRTPYKPPVASSTSIPITTPNATRAERIHQDTAAKLGNAVKFKGITDKQLIVDILNTIAESEFGVTGFMNMDEDDAQTLTKRIMLPITKQQDLLALVDPFIG